jgi:hypothetical protein
MVVYALTKVSVVTKEAINNKISTIGIVLFITLI